MRRNMRPIVLPSCLTLSQFLRSHGLPMTRNKAHNEGSFRIYSPCLYASTEYFMSSGISSPSSRASRSKMYDLLSPEIFAASWRVLECVSLLSIPDHDGSSPTSTHINFLPTVFNQSYVHPNRMIHLPGVETKNLAFRQCTRRTYAPATPVGLENLQWDVPRALSDTVRTATWPTLAALRRCQS